MPRFQNDSVFKTYLNPVYRKSFPDPFVLKFRGEYFGYCTGFADDGNVFGMVRSKDLVEWTELGGAMAPLNDPAPYYWAPEVVYDNGKFYLYYSVGNETLMELRVGVSDRPDGGFVDAGHRLTTQDFAIDAHVFIDDDGSKYLFYATDFLDHTFIGTGTVVDRMVNWFTLEGNPRPVTRAKYDWQVYDPNRKEKGGVRWHTVEGPAVLKRKGIYYEMFSGGNWQNTTYGVSFAVSDDINAPDEWLQFSDGENVLPVLRTLPEVIGPGHNCVVRGPNNRELYCVYHRWTDEGRVMAIDRLDFAGNRIFIVGATHTPQPCPFESNVHRLDPSMSNGSKIGAWKSVGHSLTSGEDGKCEIEFASLPPGFLCELSLRCVGPPNDNGSIFVELKTEQGSVKLTFHSISNVMRIEVPEDSTGLPSICKLPPDFDWGAAHLLRIEVDFRSLKLSLDESTAARVDTFLSAPVKALAISSENQSVAVDSFEVTEGFEERFERLHLLTENGWDISTESEYAIEGGELRIGSPASFRIQKHWPLPSFEFAANLRVIDTDRGIGQFGLLLNSGGLEAVRFVIDREASALRLNGEAIHNLPSDIDLTKYHQLRIINTGGHAICYFDDALVYDLKVTDSLIDSSIFCEDAQLAVEMIRLTGMS